MQQHFPHPHTKERALREGGFTIIELIVVIGVISVLAGIVTAYTTQYIDRAKETRMAADEREMAIAATISKGNVGAWAPDTIPGSKPCWATSSGCSGTPQTYTGGFDASFYCSGCKYDWQNWGTDPDCIIIDVLKGNWPNEQTVKRFCISVDRCPSYCSPPYTVPSSTPVPPE